MNDFGLVSIDWETVRLLQAGQFKLENHYHEELVRWGLQRSRTYGVLHMADNAVSRPSPEGERTFSVKVRGFIGVAELGHIIEIPDDAPVEGIIEARTQTVPLYVGVSILEKSREAEIYSSVDVGLLQCGGLRAHVSVSNDNSDSSVDWLQIAQFEKTTSGLSPSPAYIPDCMFLSSHGGQWGMVTEIRDLAKQCLTTLEKNSREEVQVYTTAAALCGPLGLAARNVDQRAHPHAYIDRIVGVLASQRSQLRVLPKINLRVYQEALDSIDSLLTYVDDEWTPGQALLLSKECFERLLKLYEQLLQQLVALAPPPARVQYKEEDVVQARQPLHSDQQTEPEPEPEQRPRIRGTIWKR